MCVCVCAVMCLYMHMIAHVCLYYYVLCMHVCVFVAVCVDVCGGVCVCYKYVQCCGVFNELMCHDCVMVVILCGYMGLQCCVVCCVGFA